MADEIKTIPDELREKLESGCALLLRSMLDCQDASYGIDHFGAMAWFILAAAWKESCFLGHRLQRGQLFIGREIYAKKWHITERRFRTILTHLKNSGFLTIKTTSKGSIITICNYDTYQNFFKLIDQLRDQQVTSNRPASDHNQLNKAFKNFNTPPTCAHDGFEFSADETKNLSDAEREEWRRWLMVWGEMHGKGKPMNPIVREAQLANLLRVPAEYRLVSLQKAVAGGWKNINDVSKDERRTDKKKFDPMDPSTFMIPGGENG